MPDLLDSIREQLRARLDELRPLVREYQRLQDAERALGDEPPIRAKRAAPAKPAEPRRSGGARTASRRRSSAPAEREANRQRILDLVRRRPGITRAELKDAASLSGAGVAQNLRRMLDRGQVREEALPGGTTGYRIADGQKQPTAKGPGGETQQ
jgi:Winged helix-turn-helix DNA-binding